MKMKIGNGCLELGIFARKDEFTILELKKVAEDALDIYPLGKILHVAYINRIKVPTIFSDLRSDLYVYKMFSEIRKSAKKLDIVALIKKNTLSQYYNALIYSVSNPITLAHELGHALGLSHPSPCPCDYALCEEKYQRQCPYYLKAHIMSCADNEKRRSKGFSPEDIERLERWFLK